jgi:hypothetical protein
MPPHGNALDNPNPHHLYEIYKKADKDTYKYGISDDLVEKDGLSARARNQTNEMNRAAEFEKYAAEVLLADIPGRAQALKVEREHIDAYFEKHGHNPTGNILPKRKTG